VRNLKYLFVKGNISSVKFSFDAKAKSHRRTLKTVNQAQKKFFPCLLKRREFISHGMGKLNMKTGDDFDMRFDGKNIRSRIKNKQEDYLLRDVTTCSL
jgi:hypothetical protein